MPSPASNSSWRDDHNGFDPKELTRLLSLLPSKQDEMTEVYKARAKENYNRIIEMGGRPSRPIREQPIWNAIYRDGLIYISDNEGELECTLSDNIDPMNYHWGTESAEFRRELEKWQSLKDFQKKIQHFDRLETELELDYTDVRMINTMTRLTDWQEFEAFQRLIVRTALSFEDHCLCDYLWIRKWEASTEPPVVHGAIRTWLTQMNRCQEDLEAAKKVLNWIRSEWPKLVADVLDAEFDPSELQPTLEAKFEKQTNATFTAILKLGGQPSHAIVPPDKSLDGLHRLLYWSSESSKYKKELSDWHLFLQWRKRELGDNSTEKQGYRCPTLEKTPEFYAEFENFRRFEHQIALNWLECWQTVVRWYEDEMGVPDSPGYLEHYAKLARSHLRDSEQNLAVGATRLENSVQEHAHARLEPVPLTGGEIKETLPPCFLPTPPPSFSESPSCSSVQPYPSPPSSQFSQSSQSHEPLLKNRTPSSKSKKNKKVHRRSKEATRRGEARLADTNKTHQPPPTFSPGSLQVEKDDDVQIMDTLEDSNPAEATEEFGAAESEDTTMTDYQDPPNHVSSNQSKPHLTPIKIFESKRLPSSNAHASMSRKTRFIEKLGQAPSGRISKPTGKKSAKPARKVTEQQAMMLLNVASNKGSLTESTLPRRSERLKEKAAALAIISQTQLNAAQTPQSLGHKQPEKQAGHTEPSRPSKRKRSEIQLDVLEPAPTPRRKKPKLQLDALEPPQTSEHKKPNAHHDALESSQTSEHEKPKAQHDALEPPQIPRRKKPKIQPDAPDLPQTLQLRKLKMESKANEPYRKQRNPEQRAPMQRSRVEDTRRCASV